MTILNRLIILGFHISIVNTILAQVPNINQIDASTASAQIAGPNVQVSNAVFNGQSVQLANFWNGSNKTGISTGVVVATCDAAYVHHWNTGLLNEGSSGYALNSSASDPDLDQINGSSYPKDAAVLEFDFVSTGLLASFSYVFASNEYPEWVNSGYNDAFGFFISGPGINGPFSNNSINIATINSAPVSVNTVNSFTNSAFYITTPAPGLGEQDAPPDGTGDPNTWAFVFDGRTIVMSASIAVQCNTTYHAKIAICNTQDHSKQSAVFLQQGSLTSPYTPPGPLTIAPSPVCAGEEITLNVQGDPSWNYTWSTGQSGVGLQTVTTTATLDQNTYSVTAEYLDGCFLTTSSPSAMLTVHDPFNYPPQCLGVNGSGVYTTTMQEGQQTCFTIPTNDAANEVVDIDATSSSISGASFTGDGALHETGTFCWVPTTADIGFHTLEVTSTDNNTCGELSNTCTITIKVVCEFCPIRVFYERRSPGGLPLPALTVAGESITAGYSVDPTQQDGDVNTGNASVEFRAPYIDLQPGFLGGPGFLAVPDPNTCIVDCNDCCSNWPGFTEDTYDPDGDGVYQLNNWFEPDGDGWQDYWQVHDADHPFCAYGAQAYELRIWAGASGWGTPVWYVYEAPEGCCPFESRAPENQIVHSSIYWDGTVNTGYWNNYGSAVSSGTYFYILTLYGCIGEKTYTGDIFVSSDVNGMVVQEPSAGAILLPGQVLMADTMGTMETMVTGVDQLPAAQALLVAPNPTTGEVSIQFAPGLARAGLLDAVGRQVMEWHFGGEPVALLDLKNLSSGSYMLIITDTMGNVHNRKLIKQ